MNTLMSLWAELTGENNSGAGPGSNNGVLMISGNNPVSNTVTTTLTRDQTFVSADTFPCQSRPETRDQSSQFSTPDLRFTDRVKQNYLRPAIM